PALAPYPRRTGGHVGNRHGRRGTCDAGHVVMLREPNPPVAPPLRVLREVARIVQGLAGVSAVDDWRKIEKRIRNHPPTVLRLERFASPAQQAGPAGWVTARGSRILHAGLGAGFLFDAAAPFGGTLRWHTLLSRRGRLGGFCFPGGPRLRPRTCGRGRFAVTLPFVVIVRGNAGHRAPGEDGRVVLLRADRPVLLLAFLQQPDILPVLLANAVKLPISLELPAVQAHAQASFRMIPAEQLERAYVPDDHRAAAVLSGRDRPLEVEVVERMVLRLEGRTADLKLGGQSLRDRPRFQRSVHLQPKIIMQVGGGVFLDHKPRRVMTT